jgi:hypothetical protein
MKKSFLWMILVLSLSLIVVQEAPSATVEPNQGVVFEQVDFIFPEAQIFDSSWGRILADASTLTESTGISRGYLNVYTNEGWVIDNLPVDINGSNSTAAYFTLGLDDPEDVSILNAHVDFSTIPLLAFSDGQRSDFEVGSFQALADDVECVQSDVENVQAAVNQCVPMSVANSLQFLENATGIVVPHDHEIGLRGDDSLVGQLDEKMDRFVPDPADRTRGGGLSVEDWLKGKFEYLVENLTATLKHKHQGRGFGSISDGDFEHMGISSEDNCATVTWEFICNEICEGEDVELAYSHSTGGHAVRVVGCGNTGGKEWIMYAHDALQSDDTAGLETVKVNVEDLDNDGTLNLGSESREIIFVLSESVIIINEPPNCNRRLMQKVREMEILLLMGWVLVPAPLL